MGRTLLPFRIALDAEIETWKGYRRGLRIKDREFFDKIIQDARSHGDAGSLAARPMLSEIIFISNALEQQKMIHLLSKEIAALTAKIKALEKQNVRSIKDEL